MVKLSLLLGFAVFGAIPDLSAQNGVTINKAPTRDFASYVQQQVRSNRIDLNAPFDIELAGTLSRSGKIESGTLKYLRATGDKAMVEVAKRAIEAVNDAGYLQYLRDAGANELRISAKQDDSAFAGVIAFAVESETRAKTLASALSMAAQVAKAQKQNQTSSSISADELVLLESTKVSAASKIVTIDITMAKQTFRDMIERAVAK